MMTQTPASPATAHVAQKVAHPSTHAAADALHALVHSVVAVADGVISIELHPALPDISFPAFAAGAHIDLHLPNGLVRSYSLHNSQEDVGRYRIGVLRDRSSRGGSSWVHSELRAGDVLPISKPRNNFALVEDAPRSVFVSGGIGITPLLSMMRRLDSLDRAAHLLYCARNRREAPFLRDLEKMVGDRLAMQLHFSEESGATASLEDYLRAFTPNDHFYCCGPSGMLDAFEAACEALGFPNVHVERFRAATVDSGQAVPSGQCVVELAKSGRTLHVPKEKPLLSCLLEADVDVLYSCEEGVCGSCETRILAGEADHRDSILSKSQKASNSVMMVCVSRCKSDHMVLDL
ncbi:2Fe-2S iron-sulfur cluster-binding protein [Cupriavidus sp. 2TAF22]|uniref:PDR/VanB family oxidoreductase n=1 Tax=unclassified Cupriavidus TaxID=2640874 RepID=UPI003F939190